MRNRNSKRLSLNRESLRNLTEPGLAGAKGAGPTAQPTCVGYTCLDSCATCYATCVTCGASCTC